MYLHIMHDLDVFRVACKIQVMSSLQVDDLFTISSWT